MAQNNRLNHLILHVLVAGRLCARQDESATTNSYKMKTSTQPRARAIYLVTYRIEFPAAIQSLNRDKLMHLEEVEHQPMASAN